MGDKVFCRLFYHVPVKDRWIWVIQSATAAATTKGKSHRFLCGFSSDPAGTKSEPLLKALRLIKYDWQNIFQDLLYRSISFTTQMLPFSVFIQSSINHL